MTSAAFKWLDVPSMWIKREFRLPWGICDLVGVQIDLNRALVRLADAQKSPIGSLLKVSLLHYIPDVGTGQFIDFDSLRVLVDEAPEVVRRELRALCGRRLVVESRNGEFQSLKRWAPIHTRVVAVELKLSRIEEVISQARQHQAFATESFIGLPEDRAERFLKSERVHELHDSGLGLLSVTPRCASVLVWPTANNHADPVLQMHCVEQFWRTAYYRQASINCLATRSGRLAYPVSEGNSGSAFPIT